MDFFGWIGSCVTWLWNCCKSIFSSQGSANEAGSEATAPFLSGFDFGKAITAALGVAMLVNPSGTSNHLSKVTGGVVDVIGDTAGAVVDNVGEVIDKVASKPWFWVGAGIFVLWLLKD